MFYRLHSTEKTVVGWVWSESKEGLPFPYANVLDYTYRIGLFRYSSRVLLKLNETKFGKF